MEDTGAGLRLLAYFQQGGIAMYPLLLCSVLSIGIAIERIVTLCRASKSDAAVAPELAKLLAGNHTGEASDRCARGDSPLARAMLAALAPMKGGPEQRQKALDRALTRETGYLERYLPVLATIGSVSPFIGLFGTVLGIMRAFRDIGLAGSAGRVVVAAGIAEALITPATGLFVAVVAVIAYNHLMTWAQSIITHTELTAEELLAQLGE
jgi:biopolymer transport protein ExbB/TolQ